MLVLAILTVSLLLAHAASVRLARRARTHMMRPGDQWEAEDLDRWLALIEPFDLEDSPTRNARE